MNGYDEDDAFSACLLEPVEPLLLFGKAVARHEVEMRMLSGQLDTVFTASQAMTRELLQDGMSKLKDTFNQMGMDVASMQVGDGQTRQRGGESTPGQMSKSTNTGVNASESTTTSAVNAPRMKMGQDGWDVLV